MKLPDIKQRLFEVKERWWILRESLRIKFEKFEFPGFWMLDHSYRKDVSAVLHRLPLNVTSWAQKNLVFMSPDPAKADALYLSLSHHFFTQTKRAGIVWLSHRIWEASERERLLIITHEIAHAYLAHTSYASHITVEAKSQRHEKQANKLTAKWSKWVLGDGAPSSVCQSMKQFLPKESQYEEVKNMEREKLNEEVTRMVLNSYKVMYKEGGIEIPAHLETLGITRKEVETHLKLLLSFDFKPPRNAPKKVLDLLERAKKEVVMLTTWLGENN